MTRPFHYFNDGVHMIKAKEETMTEEQKKVMRTQDIRYVEVKRVSEMKVGMKSELHFLDVDEEKKNNFLFMLVEDFNLATHLNTVPELLGRAYNRPTIETLEKKSIVGAVEPKRINKLAKQRELQYLRLSQRIDREKNMFVISQKIQTRKDLQVSEFIYISLKPLQHGHFSTFYNHFNLVMHGFTNDLVFKKLVILSYDEVLVMLSEFVFIIV
uniref:Probable U3 small nucleolar RNA-associated protein 11 n=1 Tax=Sinocyclocheilus anshuiensis TaxID=1608454 RepID=A0A671T3V2_9TELE